MTGRPFPTPLDPSTWTALQRCLTGREAANTLNPHVIVTRATGYSDRTIRRRLYAWAQAGLGPALLRICLAAYDRMIGLDLYDLAVDGCITKAPCGGEVAGRSPVDRGKQGMKRSVANDGGELPLHLVAARANKHDSPLLEPTLTGIVDRGVQIDHQPWQLTAGSPSWR